MVDYQRVENLDVAANVGAMGVRGRPDSRVNVLIDHVVFKVEVYVLASS